VQGNAKIRKPTCVGFLIKLVQLITLQQVQQLARKQQVQQPVRKQQEQLQQQEQQEQQLCHKRTKTEPTEQQRSEQRISSYFLQLIIKLREC
jgi:hypothetical protein